LPKRRSGQLHRIVGLFAGIGGLELGLRSAGHVTQLLCESDPSAAAVLRDKFPRTKLHTDVRTLRNIPRGTSLIAAGFPCQDLSQAGQTRGIRGSNSRLVESVFRLVAKHRTPWVLLENVPFMLRLAGGKALNLIASKFESLGYAWAYRVVDSRAFGLPQRRRRVYFLATRTGDPRTILFADDAKPRPEPSLNGDAIACGFYWTEGLRGLGWAVDAIPTLKGGSTLGIPSPPAILLPGGGVITPSIVDAERLQGFPASWTRAAEIVQRRGARWRLVGNAVSVPAARWIGRRLRQPGKVLRFDTCRLARRDPWPDAAWNVGAGRVEVAASEWPVCYSHRSLSSFVRGPTKPLSAKATAGFLSRTRRATLRFPPKFLQALRNHLRRMQSDD
jgi:DNA (cytosine-5)-methyltransferase 1